MGSKQLNKALNTTMKSVVLILSAPACALHNQATLWTTKSRNHTTINTVSKKIIQRQILQKQSQEMRKGMFKELLSSLFLMEESKLQPALLILSRDSLLR